jgi:AcrR family transcriptional regulator
MSRKPEPLSTERIVSAALEVADRDGAARLTMRSLAGTLGVTPMSIYRYVANKDALLDAMVDAVFAEIRLPQIGADWRTEILDHADSARQILLTHPWALSLMDTRSNPGMATMIHHDAVIGTLRAGGFSIPHTAQAFSLLDSYVYGFVLQELSLPFDAPGQTGEVIGTIAEEVPIAEFPHLAELVTEHFTQPHYRFGDQFNFGLDIVLDGLAALTGQT